MRRQQARPTPSLKKSGAFNQVPALRAVRCALPLPEGGGGGGSGGGSAPLTLPLSLSIRISLDGGESFLPHSAPFAFTPPVSVLSFAPSSGPVLGGTSVALRTSGLVAALGPGGLTLGGTAGWKWHETAILLYYTTALPHYPTTTPTVEHLPAGWKWRRTFVRAPPHGPPQPT